MRLAAMRFWAVYADTHQAHDWVTMHSPKEKGLLSQALFNSFDPKEDFRPNP